MHDDLFDFAYSTANLVEEEADIGSVWRPTQAKRFGVWKLTKRVGEGFGELGFLGRKGIRRVKIELQVGMVSIGSWVTGVLGISRHH